MLTEKLKSWCDKYNTLQRTVDSFWLRFEEYKKKNFEKFEELNFSLSKQDNIKIYFEKIYYGISIDNKDKTFVVIELFSQFEEEDLGIYRVKYNEKDGEEINYEIFS